MPDAPSPVILTDTNLFTPADREFWTTPDMVDVDKRYPMFSVAEVAKCFFGMSGGWLRKHLKNGTSTTQWDGETILPLRTTSGARTFRLYDIERIAHALAYNKVTTGQHLGWTITVVKTVARLHGYIS